MFFKRIRVRNERRNAEDVNARQYSSSVSSLAMGRVPLMHDRASIEILERLGVIGYFNGIDSDQIHVFVPMIGTLTPRRVNNFF